MLRNTLCHDRAATSLVRTECKAWPQNAVVGFVIKRNGRGLDWVSEFFPLLGGGPTCLA